MALGSLERPPGVETDVSGLTPGDVMEQLDLITSSPLFSKSKRYPNFLRYIVERTLSGEVDQLKERTLGVEVFNRPSDYDTNSDPVVRITAGEIRKRLAQYYGEPGHDQQLRVDLPLGSYTPLISKPEPAQKVSLPESPKEAPPGDRQSEPALPERSHDGTSEVRALSNPDQADASTRRETRFLRAIVVVLLILLASIPLAYLGQLALSRRHERGVAAFWQPLLHAEAPALIVVGVHALGPDGKDLAPMSGTGQKGSMLASMTGRDMVPLSDLISYGRITDLLTRHGHPYRTESAAETTFEHLQPGPVVLIGGLDNVWTLRLLAPLRFRFRGQASVDGVIEDTSRPGTSWRFNNAQSAHSNSQDYAIVASFFDPTIEQRVVVAAGIGRGGTVAATNFLTSTRQLQTWVAQNHPPAGANVEIVLSTEIVEGAQGPPRVVASYIW